MIELKNIKKKYKNKIVLNNISITFPNNGLFFIQGFNGSGKTTLLNIISFIDKNIDGEINIDNIDYSSLSKNKQDKYRKSNIYYIKPKDNILSFTNCNEFIKLSNRTLNYELVNNINLNKYSKEISGGEEILVALTAALNSKKKIILLDEISSQLDTFNLNKIMNILLKAKKDRLIIFATHDNRILKFKNFKKYELKGGLLYDKSK